MSPLSGAWHVRDALGLLQAELRHQKYSHPPLLIVMDQLDTGPTLADREVRKFYRGSHTKEAHALLFP